MTVYIAAPYPERAYAQRFMRDLEALGHEVTSRWLREEDALSDEHARNDLADIDRADALVALNVTGYHDKGTGGRHVELGYALARRKRIVLVGVRTNMFHYLREVLLAPTDNAAGVDATLSATVPS